MTMRDDRSSADAPPSADDSAATSADAFAPGGEPRAGTEAADSDGGGDAAAPASDPSDAADGDAASVRRELAAQRDKYLRLAAEYDNYRKRSARESREAGARAQAELVRPLLDALDDLDRVTQVEVAATSAQTVVEGVALVGRKLAKALSAAGLEVVNPVDEAFDPNRHEAVATAPAASAAEDHTVAQVYQPGYVFGGQLLRPARVVVRQWNG